MADVSGSESSTAGRAWTRYLGVSLIPTTPEAVGAAPALVRALTDGWDRAGEAMLPEAPPGAQWYRIRERRADVGVAIVLPGCPRPGESALLAVAVSREARGRACATKALLAAERRLLADGASRMLTRVPRTNGRGLYFMLRAGFTPVPAAERPDDPGDATWFSRKPRGRPRGGRFYASGASVQTVRSPRLS